MAYLTGSRSQFPEQLDTILELFNLPPSQKDNAARYQYLATKENLSSLEQTELNNLSVILQDYLPDVETWNLLGDILINMQKFFKEGVEPFVNDLKDNALNEIENKKQDIIDYMDETTAGAIRNDIGVMGDSTIEGRSLVDKTNNLDDKINNLSTEVVEHKADNVTTHNVSRGVSNFAGSGQEVTIPHGLPVTPTSAYAFPTVNPEGYLGEVWIRMDETNLYIGNSGSFTGEMSWVAIG